MKPVPVHWPLATLRVWPSIGVLSSAPPVLVMRGQLTVVLLAFGHTLSGGSKEMK